MTRNTRGPPKSGLWAYTYDITLPESEDHFRSVQELLEREHFEARAGARTWAAQVVVEPQVTRILVVSDSPAQDRAINRSLEAALTAMRATFVVTEPMAVSDDA
ncbi:MAG: hypothetical protein P8170_09850 [Gemmatimonadota bacterium]